MPTPMNPVEVAPLDVLIIEDDPDTRANLADILTLDGHRCDSVGSFQEALEFLGTKRASAVILDRQLPDGTADDFIPRIKQHSPELPIVVVTGYPDIENAIESLRVGAYDYLLKPVNAEALRASLRRIAERQVYVEQLRNQRDFAEEIIELAQAIVLILDADGGVVRYNSYMQELSGIPLDQALGKDCIELFVHPEDASANRDLLAEVAQGRRIRGYEARLVTRGGGERIIDWSATLLPAGQHGVGGILAIGHDITDLRAAQEKLVQGERLAAIGEMMTGLAHESRNAFQRSQACLEMLALDLDGNPDSLKTIHRIQAALDHLRGLYEQVRGYAAPIKLQRQGTEFGALVKRTWSHLEHVWKGTDVELDLRDELEGNRVELDGYQLEQVIRNLFENAIDACQARGKILVRLRAVSTPFVGVELVVEDEGPGVPVAIRDRIFEPFFTTKTRGTGLGMAISKRIVEAHGGTIELAPEGDRGAVFVIRLPKGRVSLEPKFR